MDGWISCDEKKDDLMMVVLGGIEIKGMDRWEVSWVLFVCLCDYDIISDASDKADEPYGFLRSRSVVAMFLQ